MKKFIIITLLLVCSLLYGQERKTLLAGPVTNELENEDFDAFRIGFGLRSTLSQIFYETGYFILIEEKDEIKEEIAKSLQRAWLNEGEIEDVENQLINLSETKPQMTATANIIYLGRPRSRLSIGVFHSKSAATILKIEVTLKNLETGDTWEAVGEGESETTATSALLQINEKKIEFDKSTLGIATREAISKAVDEIMEDYLDD